MSNPFIEFDLPTGTRVIGAGYSDNPPQTSMVFPQGTDPYQYLNHYLSNGQLEPRPLSPTCVQIAGGWRIPSCPIGTVIIIYDLIGQEAMTEIKTSVANEDVEFTLSDSGLYEIEVSAPFPHVRTKLRIEIP